jgi:hypothetical protein
MDKAEALRVYARQWDDRDLEVWVAEIKQRAAIRIGQLVQELPTYEGFRGIRPSGGTNEMKQHSIEDAGLSKTAVYRYEEVAGPRH